MHKTETKEKGDIGLTQIIADLQLKGIGTALPLAEHMPFDLIAIDDHARLAKISVKYRAMNKFGSIEIPMRSISSNSQGYRVKKANLDEIDVFAIYCPDNRQCYYIPSCKLKGYRAGMSLTPYDPKFDARRQQFNYAHDYQDHQAIFWRHQPLSGELAEPGLSREA